MKRLLYIDYIKVIAIFFVLIYHCHYVDTDIYFASVLSMCCPLFFAVNGTLLLSKDRTYSYFIPKLAKLFVLIFFWGIISNWYSSWIFCEPYSIKQSVVDVLQLRMQYCNYLWFLCTLFILYLVYPLTRNLVIDKKMTWISLIVVCCLTLTGISRYMGIFNPLKGWHSFALAYAMGGYAITKLDIKSRRFPIVVYILSVFAQIVLNYFDVDKANMIWGGYKTPFVFFATLSLIKYFSMIECRENAIIDFVARNTLGIYLVHRFFTLFISQQDFTSVYRHLLPIVVLIISCVICWLMNTNKYTKWLISV